MNKHSFFFSICAFIVSILTGCEKTDLTASYIAVESTDFVMDLRDYNLLHETNYDAKELEAIASQKFSDVWVYVDGKDLGTWELPCKIPILATDSTEVLLYPGVKMDGSSTRRPRYPFVQGCTLKLPLKGGQILEIESIPLKYYDETVFDVVETFEADYNQYFESYDTTGITFERIPDPDKPSNRIGVITLRDTIDEFSVVSSPLMFNSLPSSVFLEMDYRFDSEDAQDFYVGMLIGKSNTSAITHEPLVGIKPTTEWKKVYINLTQSILRNQLNATSYQVIISGGKSNSNDVHIYFDNIKVVYL